MKHIYHKILFTDISVDSVTVIWVSQKNTNSIDINAQGMQPPLRYTSLLNEQGMYQLYSIQLRSNINTPNLICFARKHNLTFGNQTELLLPRNFQLLWSELLTASLNKV